MQIAKDVNGSSLYSALREVTDPIFKQDTHHVGINVTWRRLRTTIVAVEKPIKYSEFVFVALVIQHAMRMRHTVICGLSDPYNCNAYQIYICICIG